jgi:CRISPR system Cascade subunit CasB
MSGYHLITSGEQSALQHWHRSLKDNRGDRARLRRAERPEDVLLCDAFFHFLNQMPEGWREQKPLFTSAAVAGLLAHVEEDRQIESRGYQPKDENKPKNMASFAELLARPIKGERPPVSELRFQQLQKSRNTDEFYRGVIRAINLLSGRVNIPSLSNDVIHWHQEFNSHVDREPAKRLAVRWATDYFTALPKENR